MFDSVLIANRGEIAARVAKTCQKLGIRTVAIYSEPDENAPHTELADEAYQVGPAHVLESYLNQERILDIADEADVDAIHPGYGLLSENADFANAVTEAGFKFVGPRPEVMDLMSDKSKARDFAEEADVPVVPGSDGPVGGEEAAVEFAEEFGYPLLVKASAGGGGIGMQVADDEQQLRKAVQQCQRRGESSFGDDSIYLERFIEDPRHVEIQILADEHDNCLHVLERECSVQRRHQKVIEETPSIASRHFDTIPDEMAAAAVRLADHADYTNAGTVEFVVDEEGNYYFIEMNTRLQVEHTITEETTGIDLVEQQLRIAAGDELPFSQSDIERDGHSIQCRIYAEDPQKRFAPSPGLIESYSEPEGEGVRVDSGVREGYEVTRYYDPLLAKLVTYGESRKQARQRMESALEDYTIEGPTTNIDMHGQILRDAAFLEGDYHTEWLEDWI